MRARPVEKLAGLVVERDLEWRAGAAEPQFRLGDQRLERRHADQLEQQRHLEQQLDHQSVSRRRRRQSVGRPEQLVRLLKCTGSAWQATGKGVVFVLFWNFLADAILLFSLLEIRNFRELKDTGKIARTIDKFWYNVLIFQR